MNTTGEHIAFDDLASFALHALEGAEAAPVAKHVRSCMLCQGELANLRCDLGLYAQVVTLHEAPSGCRRRLLDQVACERRETTRRWPVDTSLCGNAPMGGRREQRAEVQPMSRRPI